MVYYLGRDVIVALATENSTIGITSDNDSSTISASASGTARALGSGSEGAVSGNWPEIPDVTGVDVGIGAMDEDISYFGIRSVTKAEIKKETTVTVTKKKNSSEWDTVFNDARYGVSGASQAWPGLEEPSATHGYRVFIQLKSGSEVLSIPNCCVQSHTVSTNADGVTEETIEFMSYVTPYIRTTCITGTTNPF